MIGWGERERERERWNERKDSTILPAPPLPTALLAHAHGFAPLDAIATGRGTARRCDGRSHALETHSAKLHLRMLRGFRRVAAVERNRQRIARAARDGRNAQRFKGADGPCFDINRHRRGIRDGMVVQGLGGVCRLLLLLLLGWLLMIAAILRGGHSSLLNRH